MTLSLEAAERIPPDAGGLRPPLQESAILESENTAGEQHGEEQHQHAHGAVDEVCVVLQEPSPTST